ncbi:phytoene desaturase [Echinicola strongylocentroti]|uniref:Phytoene desaturase n=1 Tax=Echinicola strongylocentroti TaxID=1795355 RepID=A0A2Z4IJF3_9BACT|nr:phytoene desaturase family protein [Echinicola strongylocentroti]AWW30533.1 phytoene desaturase [Echinicola strongylocentroti]
MERKEVIVIGAGFAGIAAATTLAHQGFHVTVLEKNDSAGGRARKFTAEGFTFDMGPSWYWMPDIFENYFAKFGKQPSDYYDLVRLDPSYKVIFGPEEELLMPADPSALRALFESLEPGAGARLDQFLQQAARKYQVGIQDWVYKPCQSIWEFVQPGVFSDLIKLDLFQSMKKHVRSFFSNEKLIRIMEFPVLFLGQTAEKIPALYSMMNYADLVLGTWYPMGGMHEIIKAMVSLAEEQGVQFKFNAAVSHINTDNGKATGVTLQDGRTISADVVVAGADYHHVETMLLPHGSRNYSSDYWEKRTLAPSTLIFYLGVEGKVNGLSHHNLFFDEPLAPHAKAIYDQPDWPEKPLFYVCCPSKTDSSVAPEGKENLFILIPLAPGLEDTNKRREAYFDLVMDRLEKYTGQDIRGKVCYRRSYAHQDFIKDYNAFKGNAYGLANTLGQTAMLKPRLRNKKLSNLFYTGQLTVPGPGVPPSLISGQVVAGEVTKEYLSTSLQH